jgi:hypothetical protein
MEVLHTAGVPFSSGEDGLRPARLLALFREALPLEHFDLALLLETRGWDDAFASAIGDLEAAGLAPADLPGDTAHARDLALVWSPVVAEAGTSFSRTRVYLEAAALLSRDPRAWPFEGPALALATGQEDVALARFLSAIPGLTLALPTPRPARARFLERVETLFRSRWSARARRGGGPLPPGEVVRRSHLGRKARSRSGSATGLEQLLRHRRGRSPAGVREWPAAVGAPP